MQSSPSLPVNGPITAPTTRGRPIQQHKENSQSRSFLLIRTSSGKDEWIGFSTDVNIRKAPSPSAEPLRIAKRGEKLRVIGRQNNWVQVADPATSETGWVCSRFIEPAQSAAQ
jgi:uncharacterized protein YgiM (DUF1202 family)